MGPMRAESLARDRLKIAAISKYVAQYREELLRELSDEVKVNKTTKRSELLRLGRAQFSQLPESVQRQFLKGQNTSSKDIVESDIVRVALPRSAKMEPSSLGSLGVRELRGGSSNQVAAPSVAWIALEDGFEEAAKPSPPHLHPQAQSTTSPLAQENQQSELSGSRGVREFQKLLAPGAPPSPRPSIKRPRAFLDESAPSENSRLSAPPSTKDAVKRYRVAAKSAPPSEPAPSGVVAKKVELNELNLALAESLGVLQKLLGDAGAHAALATSYRLATGMHVLKGPARVNAAAMLSVAVKMDQTVENASIKRLWSSVAGKGSIEQVKAMERTIFEWLSLHGLEGTYAQERLSMLMQD